MQRAPRADFDQDLYRNLVHLGELAGQYENQPIPRPEDFPASVPEAELPAHSRDDQGGSAPGLGDQNTLSAEGRKRRRFAGDALPDQVKAFIKEHRFQLHDVALSKVADAFRVRLRELS
jgi:hypothetical protein